MNKTATATILMTVATVACGQEPPCKVDYTTSHGIAVCGSALVDMAEVEQTLQAIEDLLDIGNLQQRLADAPVYIQFQADSKDLPAGADGATNSKTLLAQVKTWPCLADSSLVHEVLHLVEYVVHGHADPDHARPGYFQGEFAAQNVLAQQLRAELASCN